jgi:hypothetical protein
MPSRGVSCCLVALSDKYPAGSKGVIPQGVQTADSTEVKLAAGRSPQTTGYGPHCALTESFAAASAKLMDSD